MIILVYDSGKFVSNPGSPVHVLYSPKVLPDGSIELKECGKENTDEVIQSFKESTDISLILAKLRAGDDSALNVTPGTYGDFTQYPKTLADVMQLQIDSRRLFESMPLDIRNKFGNDPNKFFAASGTQDWFDKISPVLSDDVKSVIYPKSSDSSVSEVKDIES